MCRAITQTTIAFARSCGHFLCLFSRCAGKSHPMGVACSWAELMPAGYVNLVVSVNHQHACLRICIRFGGRPVLGVHPLRPAIPDNVVCRCHPVRMKWIVGALIPGRKHHTLIFMPHENPTGAVSAFLGGKLVTNGNPVIHRPYLCVAASPRSRRALPNRLSRFFVFLHCNGPWRPPMSGSAGASA